MNKPKPYVLALGAVLTASATTLPLASAADNPFGMTQLSSGYMVAFADGKCGANKPSEEKEAEGKCGEGKCGEEKQGEGKCGEGKCGEK